MVVRKKECETSGPLEALRTGRHLGLLARQGIGPLASPEARRARANLVSLRRHRFIDERGRPHNIEEFLHGYCDLYAAYFLERNPDWIGIVLRRKSNGLIIHAFAVIPSASDDLAAVEESGINRETACILASAAEYADARGITEDARLFFSKYRFMPGEILVELLDSDTVQMSKSRAEELGLTQAIAELYDTVNGLRY